MTVTLIATAGAADANSYATLAEAEAYHATHLNSADWNTASDATKIVALIMATRILDNLYEWSGAVTTVTQRLLWPRVGILAKNRLSNVDDTTIPEELKFATSELAAQLIIEDLTLDSDIQVKQITSLRAGPISLSFDASAVIAKVITDSVYYLIPSGWGYVKSRQSRVRELERA